ncbi:MAG: hypothetical protein M3R71_03270 [Actinomycetota bacterium]|nr:hypothetical protein [Actinomycetota bacterium]
MLNGNAMLVGSTMLTAATMMMVLPEMQTHRQKGRNIRREAGVIVGRLAGARREDNRILPIVCE